MKTHHGGFEPLSRIHEITSSLGLRSTVYPYFPKIHCQKSQVKQCEGGPIYPSTAYQGVKTLYTYHMDVKCTPQGA